MDALSTSARKGNSFPALMPHKHSLLCNYQILDRHKATGCPHCPVQTPNSFRSLAFRSAGVAATKNHRRKKFRHIQCICQTRKENMGCMQDKWDKFVGQITERKGYSNELATEYALALVVFKLVACRLRLSVKVIKKKQIHCHISNRKRLEVCEPKEVETFFFQVQNIQMAHSQVPEKSPSQ